MKLFLKKIAFFTTLFFIIFCAFYGWVQLKLGLPQATNATITRIYAGDSHIQLAINDRVLNHSKNVGAAFECYYYTYYKLKYLLKDNPQIKSVYLGCGFHNFSDYYDEFIDGKYARNVSPRYFYLLPIEDQVKLCWRNKDQWLSYLRDLLKSGAYIINDQPLFNGGYSNPFQHEKGLKKSIDRRIQFQFYRAHTTNGFSHDNIYYFKKIIDLCASKQITLVLINTPLHQYYRLQIPKSHSRFLHQQVWFSDCSYLDLSKLQLPDDCYIPDGDHVSQKGALQVSWIIRQNTTKHFLER